jgi:hypothetical protein
MTIPQPSGYSKVRNATLPKHRQKVNQAHNLDFTGIKAKVENTQQYEEYLEELKPLREELGVNLKEDLYPGDSDSPHHNP